MVHMVTTQFSLDQTQPTIIAVDVDPGHATIISLVRQHEDAISKLEIKNTVWRDWNGNKRYQQKIQVFNERYDGMRVKDGRRYQYFRKTLVI